MTAEAAIRAEQQSAVPQLADTSCLDLVRRLADELAGQHVSYCHWKSNEALDRSLTGDNDLDLLVSRADQGRFLEVLARLGFKAAALPPQREVPAVKHYYGLDVPSGRLVHLHAHFRLVLGDDTTKNFWLPVEEGYLASATSADVLPVPSPAFELAVLVLRMVLKHATWDAMLQARGALAASERRELDWLRARTSQEEVDEIVRRHLPFLVDVWPACQAAVTGRASRLQRLRAARRLTRALAACSRRPAAVDTALRLARRTTWGAPRYLLRRPVRKRLVTGGSVVAIVGGDGSGKSTAVEGVSGWLSRAFVVRRVHLGRPRRSVTTYAVKGTLALGRHIGLWPDLAEPTAPPRDPTKPPSAAWLAWHVLTARDRHRLYVRARRVAGQGGIVVSDRYPLEQLRLMDGPRTTWARGLPGLGRFRGALVEREARYYSVFTRPDVLVVLRVDPEIAVRRKTEEEAGYVRRRAAEVWHASWEAPTVTIDASRSAEEVLSDLRAAVWERL